MAKLERMSKKQYEYFDKIGLFKEIKTSKPGIKLGKCKVKVTTQGNFVMNRTTCNLHKGKR